MHLKRMRLENIPPFTEPVTFSFDENVNMFIGPNGSGKSTALFMLQDRFMGPEEGAKRPISQGEQHLRLAEFPDDEFDEWVGDETAGGRSANVISASADWFGTKYEYYRPDINPPLISIGAVRKGLPGIPAIPSPHQFGDTLDDILQGPFEGERVLCAIEAMAKEAIKSPPLDHTYDHSKGHHRIRPRTNIRKAVHLAYDCSKTICDEVISGRAPNNYVPGGDRALYYLDSLFVDPASINVIRSMGIDTTDQRNFDHLPVDQRPIGADEHQMHPDFNLDTAPIYVGHLSSGTEGTLLWIWWLALKLVHHYEFVDGWEKQPAILLIDEIENHLHPTWQRRVIPALLKHFPGLQIFATTHSPFVVAGLKAGQVHLLNRDGNGVVTATTNTEDIIGWTADEILRTYMDVHDPTDDETASAAAELRRLRNEGTRADEQEEAARQDSIRDLRKIVDRAELSGPREAENNRFLANLDSILERHRQSQNLNQENG